jgi:MOSC domain-containing protein YiiM
MRVISVNVGLPMDIRLRYETVRTGIWKSPVEGRVEVRLHNLAGDGQADLSVHGGPNKAVYAYPSEHYEFWRRELPDIPLPWAAFGENLTTEGLLENTVHVGDEVAIGTAVLRVTQPRLPCFKLGIRFGRLDIVKRFLNSRRTGIYFQIAREGALEAGDAMTLTPAPFPSVTIAEMVELFTSDAPDEEVLLRAIAVPTLPPFWRERFEARLRRARFRLFRRRPGHRHV